VVSPCGAWSLCGDRLVCAGEVFVVLPVVVVDDAALASAAPPPAAASLAASTANTDLAGLFKR
jgi:hypothetical protein